MLVAAHPAPARTVAGAVVGRGTAKLALFQLGHAPPAQGLEVKILFANRTFPIFAAQEAIRPGTVNAAPTEALPPARTFRSRAALGANRKIFVLPECSAARSSRLKISSTLRSLLFPVVRHRCQRCYSWECCGDGGSFGCHPHPRCSRSGVQRRQRAAADPAFIVGGGGGLTTVAAAAPVLELATTTNPISSTKANNPKPPAARL